MNRFAVGACAVAFSTLPAIGPTPAAAPDQRTLPMQFELRIEGPAAACGKNCRTFVSATGAITADTPRDFETFAKTRQLKGTLIALDSDGGSVLGALALGRSIRKLGMITTVGKTVDVPETDVGSKRARLMPRAYCESMCTFVLLAGVERQVPAEARVMVHQIWLGDRRDDPTSANYSAEDLVLVQRDIGRLAQYTIEMGGSIDLLEIALKIPPWEPMRILSREELRGMKIVTLDDAAALEVNSGTAVPTPPLANGARAVVNERSWVLAESAGKPALVRKHPLTIEGEEIGAFDLSFSCGEGARDYSVAYTEVRRGREAGRLPEAVTEVEIALAGKAVSLKVVSSRPNGRPLEIESVANGRLPAEVVKAFSDTRSRSLMVETSSDDLSTAIRVGNAGLARAFPQLIASCAARTRSTASNEPRRGG